MKTQLERFSFACSVCLFLIVSACSLTEDPAITLNETSYIFPEKSQFPGTFAYIYQNDIYLYSFAEGEPQQLTFSPDETKELVALSYNKQKIAYLDSLGVPQIISNTGSFIESVPVNSPVKSIGWSPDDETLYMLVGNRLEYFGPSMPLPPLNPHVSTDEIYSVSISQNLDIAYTYKYERGINDSYIIIDYRNPGLADRGLSLDREYRNVRFSLDGSMVLISRFTQQRSRSTASVYNQIRFYERTGPQINGGAFSSTFDPVFVGNDSIAFGVGPFGGFAGRTEGYTFSNFFISPIFDSGSAYFLTNQTEESLNLYIDWKP